MYVWTTVLSAYDDDAHNLILDFWILDFEIWIFGFLDF